MYCTIHATRPPIMTYLNIVVVPQAILNVVEKLKDVESIEARLEESIHALKRSLPQVQPVINSVLKRTHLNFTNQLPLQKKEKK